MEKLRFFAIDEARPGSQFLAHFKRQWPRYAPWYFARAHGDRPNPQQCREAFAQVMPQLLPFLDYLVTMLPGDNNQLLQFFSLYQPPAFLTGCSQLALARPGNTRLVRNYDYAPERFEATLLRTCFIQPVICMTDCIWGALDGINAAGLAVSLAFGGEGVTAPGFGIPILVRYLLETCVSVTEAKACLKHIPSHMTYNLTLADASGDTATLFLGPGDLPVRQARRALATNHQEGALRRPYHLSVASFDRELFLINRLKDQHETPESLTGHFLGPPLYHRRYAQGFGTLYTAEYTCEDRSLYLHWPALSKYYSHQHFQSSRFNIQLN